MISFPKFHDSGLLRFCCEFIHSARQPPAGMLSKGARTAQHDETRWVKHSRRSCMKQARKEKRDADRAVQAGIVNEARIAAKQEKDEIRRNLQLQQTNGKQLSEAELLILSQLDLDEHDESSSDSDSESDTDELSEAQSSSEPVDTPVVPTANIQPTSSESTNQTPLSPVELLKQRLEQQRRTMRVPPPNRPPVKKPGM